MRLTEKRQTANSPMFRVELLREHPCHPVKKDLAPYFRGLARKPQLIHRHESASFFFFFDLKHNCDNILCYIPFLFLLFNVVLSVFKNSARILRENKCSQRTLFNCFVFFG